MTINCVSLTSAYPATPYQSIDWNKLFDWDTFMNGLIHPGIFRDEKSVDELMESPDQLFDFFLRTIQNIPKPEPRHDVSEIVRAIESAPKEDLCRLDPESDVSILHMAIAAQCIPAIEALLNKGVKVNEPLAFMWGKNKIFIHPILLAWGLRHGSSIETCKYLINVCARLEPENIGERSMLFNMFQVIMNGDMFTPTCNELAFLSVLVEDLDIIDNYFIPYYHCRYTTNNESQFMEDKLNIFHLAALKKNLPLMMKMKDKGYDINALTPMGFSALHFAVLPHPNEHSALPIPSMEILNLLLDNRARVNTRNNYGETPLALFFATYWRKYDTPFIEFLDLFVAYGADASSIKEESIKYLQEYVDPKNRNYLTPEDVPEEDRSIYYRYYLANPLETRRKQVQTIRELLLKIDYYQKNHPSLQRILLNI